MDAAAGWGRSSRSCSSLGQVERLPATRAALRLYRYWECNPGRSRYLPDKLRGVFWLSDHASSQLLCCFESMQVDIEHRRTTLWPASRYNWSFCDNRNGWILYLCARLLGVNAIMLDWDPYFESASARLWLMGWVPPCVTSLFATSTITQLDREGDSWAVETFLPGWSTRASPSASFTLVKVVDRSGYELPGFTAMLRTLTEEHEIKGSTVKSMEQFIPM
mmetsp:Transcript_84323/g.239162  ORF Transcript_84323/g.239162 Transcript_84323/m.239162 type:complete len:220 (+) Transcript_84323:310-969(+)